MTPTEDLTILSLGASGALGLDIADVESPLDYGHAVLAALAGMPLAMVDPFRKIFFARKIDRAVTLPMAWLSQIGTKAEEAVKSKTDPPV